MCRPDAYNKECDSGTGPAGDPRLILMKKGGLGRKLIQLANTHIVNIPPRECNVITQTCNGNSIEITSQELQIMSKLIEARMTSDDGACDWSPLNGCTYFGSGSGGQNRMAYIDLLWDPMPDFVSIIAGLPEGISSDEFKLEVNKIIDREIIFRENLNDNLGIGLEVPEIPELP